MSAAAQIVRQGGAIVSASDARTASPTTATTPKYSRCANPAALLAMIEDPAFSMFDQWQVQVQAIVQLKADCYLYSTLDNETVEKAKFIPISDIEQTLAALAEKYGPKPRIAVLPYGPLTIPYVK
jgi:nickel-dependent lactate racemase